MASHQVVTFTLNGLLFGVDVASVQEVLRFQDMTAIPLAPAVIRGLINLRGQIVTAIDMRARLALPPRDDDHPMNVIVRLSDSVASLLVDRIGDVLDLDERGVERAPETLPGTLRDVIRGVYQLERGVLLMLDLDRVRAWDVSPSLQAN